MVSFYWQQVAANRRTAEPGRDLPIATSLHLALALRGALRVFRRADLVIFGVVPILHPFPNVPVNIIKAPGIRFELADGMWTILSVDAIPGDLFKILRVLAG